VTDLSIEPREIAIWTEACASILQEVEQTLRRYVAFATEAQVVACTLYVPHTYVVHAAHVTPYLAVTSAEKQSGKSRLLDVLAALVHEPCRMVSPSAATLFRAIEQTRPTILLDEADTIFRKKEFEDIRAVLNAGFQRGQRIPRVNMDKGGGTVEWFDPFCPKVIAGIGDLPDTVQDRSIPIRLKRRLGTEPVERFRWRQAEELVDLRGRIAEWSQFATLEDALPAMPEELSDREQDAWEILLAVADYAGGDWPARARDAAVTLSSARLDGRPSSGVQLLYDLRVLYELSGNRHLASDETIAWLKQLPDAPWATWTRNGISPFYLNKLLGPFGIKTKNVRLGEQTLKGLHKAELEDAFQRYLEAEEESEVDALNGASSGDPDADVVVAGDQSGGAWTF
jgi:hypothetical protein